MSPNLKNQLFRVARLGAFAALGVLAPYLLGLHGAPTLAAIEGVAVVAGEAGFRAMFPSIEKWMVEADTTAAPISAPVVPVATAEAPAGVAVPVAPPAPPAVF